MTDYSAVASGNWSNAANWSPSGVPGNGDTVDVDGFDIAVDVDTIIGESLADNVNWAFETDNGGTITVKDGVTLTVRGRARNNGGTFFLGESGVGGATLVIDSSQSADPPNTGYAIRIGQQEGDNSVFYSYGAAGNRNTIRSDTSNSAEPGWIDDGSVAAGAVCEFTDFEDLNGGGNYAVKCSTWTDDDLQPIHFSDCTFNAGCGQIGSALNLTTNCSVFFRRCNHKGTMGSSSYFFGGSNTAVGTGIREVDDCYALQQPYAFGTTASFLGTSYGNVFSEPIFASTSNNWGVLEDTLIVKGTGDMGLPSDSASRVYILVTGATGNPHFFSLTGNTPSPATLTDFTLELDGNRTGDYGDGYVSIAAPDIVNINGMIQIPQTDGNSWGTLISCLGAANQTINVEHCTSTVDGAFWGGINVGETYNSHAGQIGEMKSSIFWNPLGIDAGVAINNINGSPNTDVVSAANADYNDNYNLGAGSEGGGYNTPMTGTPGVNDFDVDPLFFDDTRNMASWDASLGGAGTVANALTELAKMHTASWDPNYNMKALHTWVRDGFRTGNQALEDAGHDSVTVGAMPFFSGNVPPVLTNPAALNPTSSVVTPQVTSDEAGGQLWAYAVAGSGQTPNAATIKANAQSTSTPVIGVNTMPNITGLNSGALYTLAFVSEDAGAADSAPVYVDFSTLTLTAAVVMRNLTDGSLFANQAGIEYAVWDDASLAAIGAPVEQGTGSTDGNGVLLISYGSVIDQNGIVLARKPVAGPDNTNDLWSAGGVLAE